MNLTDRERLELKKVISKEKLSGAAIGIAQIVDSSCSTSGLSNKQLAVFDEFVRPAMTLASECSRGGHELEIDRLRDGKTHCHACENLHDRMMNT